MRLLRGALQHAKRGVKAACAGIIALRRHRHRAAAAAAAALSAVAGASLLVLGRSARFRQRRRHGAAAAAAFASLMLRPIAAHLWVVNLAVNAAALAWTARFYHASDAAVVSRALPASGGDGDSGAHGDMQTLRVARAVIARYAAEERRLRAECSAKGALLDAQRAYILQQQQQPVVKGGGSGGGGGGHDACMPDAAAAASAAPASECPVCLAERRCGGGSVALNPCGHVLCCKCAVCVLACPACRAPVESRVRLYGV